MRAGSFSSQILGLWDRIIPDVIAKAEGWAMTPDLGVETVPLGWKAERVSAGGRKLCVCTRVRVRAHTHTPLLAGLHQLTYLGLQKNTLYKVKHFSTCMYHGSVHRFWYTKTSLMSQMVICLSNIWGLKAPKLRHPGSFLWHLAMRKQLVYSYPFFFPFHIALQRNPSI